MVKEILHIGCGNDKIEGSLGLDMRENTDADIIFDLNNYLKPFDDSGFSRAYCIAILEHLDKIIPTMDEIWRIRKDEAKITITVPHFSGGAGNYKDPTHQHYFASRSFDFFLPEHHIHYSDSRYDVKKKHMDFRKTRMFFLEQADRKFANNHKIFYENLGLCYLFPPAKLTFELENWKQ